MRFTRLLSALLLIVMVLFLLPIVALAQSPTVVINEVMYDAADEWVELYVASPPGDMSGWTLRDTAGNTYTFPSFTPSAGDFIVIHTGPGTDDLTPPVYELYWNRGSGVWNNTGDEILLSDASAVGVDYIAYEGASVTINGSLGWTGPNPTATSGNPIALNDLGVDTDSGADWHEVLPPATPSDAAAANWLLAQQDASGGFPWTPGGSVTNNTQGPTAQAELVAYSQLKNTVYLDSAVATGDYLVPNYPRSYSDGDPRFATHDPLFLEKLSVISNTATYADFVQTNFWDELTAGTYGESNDQNAAAYAASVVDTRAGQGLVGMSPWDVAALPIAADMAGETAIRDYFMSAGVLYGLNQTNTGDTYDLLGVAGAVWASAETGVDLDPTTGEFAADNTTADLAARLAAAQLTNRGDHTGGWAPQFPATPPRFTRTVTGTWQVGFGNAFETTLTKQFNNVTTDAISFTMRFNIEQNWDYGQVLVSTDGVNFTSLAGNYTTTSDPNGNNPGNGITGYETGDAAVTETMTIPGFVSGNTYWVQFKFIADAASSGNGGSALPFNWEIDNITVNGITDDASSDNDWVVDARAVQNADTQATAYSVMALQAFDSTLYHDQIAQGVAYLRRMQTTSGQILEYPGALPSAAGSVEVHAEAQRALIATAPNAVCVDDDFVAANFGDALDGSACGMGTVIFGYDAFATIADGVDAVAAAGTVNVADGRYPETIDFTKNVTIAGQSETGVVIDTHTFNSYGLHAHGDTVDVTLRNFTLIGPMPVSFGYGIKIAGDNARATIENVTVTDSGRSGIDLNGLAAVTITNVTALNNGGVGLALTDSSNATISGLTTDGNAWGGAAVYVYGQYYTLGSDNVVFSGTNTFGELGALALQATPPVTLSAITNLTLPAELSYSGQVLGAESFGIGYTVNLANALTVAISSTQGLPPIPHPLPTYVRALKPDDYTITQGNEKLATGDFYVAEGMSIQTAEIAASDGDTIHVLDGTFPESVAITTNRLTIDGAGETQTTLAGTVDCTTSAGSVGGMTITSNISGTTISNMTITGFDDGIQMFGGPITNTLISNTATISNCRHGIYSSASAGVNGLTLRGVTSSYNNSVGPQRYGRGIWVINGAKQNITIENSTFNNNRLVGIDISDGNVTDLHISNNTVQNNGDSGIAVLGAQGAGATLVSDNTVTDNGRFGIEIKNSTGNGADSGAGSVVVSANTVSRTTAATDVRDYAGIAVFRRLPDPLFNADQPSGVMITGNIVSGYHADAPASTGEGFGIVVEGENHTVANNTLTDNDVGIQAQAGNPGLNDQNTPYFDRGDATSTANLTVSGNAVFGNGEGIRTIGAVAGTFTDNLVYANNTNGVTVLDAASAAGVTATGNQICDNGALGIENQYITNTLTATGNWWGAVDGPGPVAAGHGDEVSAGVDYSSFVTTPPTTGPCQTANLTIAKVTDPATGETGFTFGGDLGEFSLDDGGSQIFQLAPGSYTITESVKSGWELTDVSCTMDASPEMNGVSLDVARGDAVICTFTNDPLPAITVGKTAAATILPEPGGTVTFTVRITNTTAESVTLTNLTDDVYGDLNGLGTCATGASIVGNGTYECAFSGAVSGNAGDTLTDTVSATVADGESNTAAANDSASVTLTDVLPTITVAKTVTPTVLPVGGGVLTVTVTVANTSVEPVYLVSLYDDNLYRTLDGNLNGVGSCAVGQWIAVNGDYQCVFTQTVSGAAGDVRNDKITASAIDDENNIVTADSTAGAVVNTPPAFTSTPPLTATVGVPYTYTVTVTDVDGDAVSLTAPTLPAWLAFTDNGDGTGTLSGTPAEGDVGVGAVVLLARDGIDETVQQFDVATGSAPAPDTRTYIYLPLVMK